MRDHLSTLYQEFLEDGYDCVDRVVLNAYFSLGPSGGGFRMWWRQLYGSDENLDNHHLMRMAGRFSRRLRGWAKANKGLRNLLFPPGSRSIRSPSNISRLRNRNRGYCWFWCPKHPRWCGRRNRQLTVSLACWPPKLLGLT